MTLARKIVLRNLALMVGLLLLGAVAMWCMLSMWVSVHTASDEYIELRQIETVRRNIMLAEHRLFAAKPDVPAAATAVSEALAEMQHLGALQLHTDEGSQGHENDEMRIITSILSDLNQAKAILASTSPLNSTEKLNDALSGLNELAAEADELVADTQSIAKSHLRRGTILLLIAFGLILSGATIVSVLQYRGVMRPLRAIRDAVREIAGGRLTQRIAVHGETEFSELSHDVNRMASELDELYRTLEKKVEVKSRELVQSERLASVGFLAAGVAHEINNPLGIMSGFAELSIKRLREGGDAAAVEDARRTLSIIRDEAFRCREITEKLLSLSRRDDSRHDPVSLAGVIEDIALMLRAHKSYRDRELKFDIPENDDFVAPGSEAEFKQVFLNLLVNALAATDENRSEVKVSLRRVNAHIEATVADKGHGVRSGDLDRIFEPFFTTRNGEARGLGLGLSVTRAIVESYGGEITARSDGEGKGTSFTVTIPLHATKKRMTEASAA